MNLKGKKLLLMGGGAFIKDIKAYADQKGFQMIAVGSQPGAHSKLSDEYYQIDTNDVEKISELVKEKNIDGIFVGASEVNIRPAIKIAEQTGCYFYTNQIQWDTLADKACFKELLRKHGLPLIPQYEEDAELEEIVFPVIVKPVDGSGARGITVCRTKDTLQDSVAYAKKFSFSGKVIIERFMERMDDVFIRYHFQDGNYSVSSSFDKWSDFSKGGFTGMPLIYTHPTKHLNAYMEKCDAKMKTLFEDVKLRNGVITLQGFVDENEDFYFYEAGYRLGGSQSYIFTDVVNQSNSLHYMINYALTGSMSDEKISEKDDPWFKKVLCNQYIPLREGVLTKVCGLDKVRSIPGVLNVTEMCPIGTVIEANGNLNQVCLRMHLIADTWQDMDELIAKIDDTLEILDEKGRDMRMRHIRSVDDVRK